MHQFYLIYIVILSYKWPCSILDYPLCHLKFRTVLGWQRYSLQSINVGRLKSFVSILSYVKPYTISGNVTPASCWKILRLSNMNFRLKSFFRTFWFFSYQNFPVARWFLWLHEVTVWFNFTVFGILITSRPKLQFKVNFILNFYNVVLNWLWPAICLCWKEFNFVAKIGDFFNGIALIVAKDIREKKQGSWPAM